MAGSDARQSDAKQVQKAADLVRLGARLQLAHHPAPLSAERLLALFREVEGESASVASTRVPAQWFLQWQPNVHASLFVSLWRYLESFADVHGLDAVAQAYGMYLSHVQATNVDPILTVTRAWTLIRYLDHLLTSVRCANCGCDYLIGVRPARQDEICPLCTDDMPVARPTL